MNISKVNETLSMITSKVKSKTSSINLSKMSSDNENISQLPKAMKMYKVTFVALCLIGLNAVFFFDETLSPNERLQDIGDALLMDEMDIMDDNQSIDPYLQKLIESETDMDSVVHQVRRLNAAQGNPLENLRFLSLGFTNAKENGRKRTGKSYTDLLSSNAENVVRAAGELTGPLYAATCTQSLITEAVGPRGNQEFDVIILNYYGRALNGLLDLALRLRRRYPDALIIALEVRYLHHIQWHRAGSQQHIGTLEDYAKSRRLKLGTRQFFKALRDPRFTFKWRGFEEREQVIENMKQDLRPAIRVRSMHYDEDVGKSLYRYHRFYSEDYHGLSVEGHLRLYNAIKNAVESYMKTKEYNPNPRRGSWGQGDSCLSWYTSGDVRGLRYKRNGMALEKFTSKEGELYALSTQSYFGWGWIDVENRFNTPRNLILSYMASGPVSIYPKTEILLDCSGKSRRERLLVYPVTKRDMHRVLTTKIATIDPGVCRISWRAMERTERPFRVTAVKILSRAVDESGVLGPTVDFDLTPY